MNIFIVTTPLQLLNAIEAKVYFELEVRTCVLVVFYASKDARGYSQILKLIKADDWADVHCFTYNPKLYYLEIIRGFFWLKKLSRRLNQPEIVFYGSYYGGGNRNVSPVTDFVLSLKPEKICLFDDGIGSMLIFAGNDVCISATIRRRIEMLVRTLLIKMFFGIKRLDVVPSAYFTVYDFVIADKNKVFKNEYSFLKQALKYKTASNIVYFIGSNLSEEGFFKDNADELKLLREVAKTYRNRKIYYIPHRFEANAKVEMYCEELGWDICRFDGCVESELASCEIVPADIAGFYSSALVNCGIIFDNLIKVTAFIFDPSILKKTSAQNDIDKINKVYKYGFNVSTVTL